MKKTKLVNSILLTTVFLLGVGSAVDSIVIAGFQNFWSKTCNIYPESGFWCENNSVLTSQVLTAAVVFLAGYFLLVKWLKLMDVKKLAVISVTFLVLLVLKTGYEYNQLISSNSNGGDYLSSGVGFFLNWSSYILAALLSSMWLLLPFKKASKK